MARERIGIMGGTFNPVHQGHIDMAKAAAAQEKLSRVLFLPTGNPPHKREGLVDAEDRYRMAAAAIAQDDVLTPSRLEIDRTGVIYTVDTLTLLREKYPRAQLYFIIGMDTLLELQHWRSYEQVYLSGMPPAGCGFSCGDRGRTQTADPVGRQLYLYQHAAGQYIVYRNSGSAGAGA